MFRPYPKPKTIKDPKYRAHLRTQPCAVCGGWPTQAAHQRLLGGSTGKKPGDDKALPECYDCHIAGEHQKGVLTMWNERSGLKFKDKHDLRDHIEVLCVDMYREFKGR